MGLDQEGAGERWLAHCRSRWRPAIREIVEPRPAEPPAAKRGRVPESLTYAHTARRSFEVAYWKTIASLAEAPLLNKNNADCVLDEATQRVLPYHDRHLERLGDQLLAYYRQMIAAASMTGKALAGDVPFRWRTDFDYSWMGGWLKNQDADAERNLHRRDPRPGPPRGGHHGRPLRHGLHGRPLRQGTGRRGARLAACGADDNHSATAALMLAAPDLPGDEPAGEARLRRLAGPPDRRGVPRRLPRGPGPDRAARRSERSTLHLPRRQDQGPVRRRRSAGCTCRT